MIFSNKTTLVQLLSRVGNDAFSPLLSTTYEGAEIFVDERDFDRASEVYNAFFGSDTTPLTGGPVKKRRARKKSCNVFSPMLVTRLLFL